MKMTFRWYGEDDKVSLDNIRQIPLMHGVVTAIYDIPVGEVWPRERIKKLVETVEAHGMPIDVIESVPVHEDIKMGKPSRDKLLDNYCQTLRNLGAEGIHTVCYNFMPVFDWTRTKLDFKNQDGSTSLIFEEDVAAKMDPLSGDLELPGWDASYTKSELEQIMTEYQSITQEDLWDNITYFLQRVIPVAEEAGITMVIHPDDPPYPIFGLPRIITGLEAAERFLDIVDSPSNSLTVCCGSYGSTPENNPVEILRMALERDRVKFVHGRNVKFTEGRSFHEVPHPTEYGDVDLYNVVKVLSDYDYKGFIRPDHGRMIWGETGRPGYGLYDRALGCSYLNGLWEAIRKEEGKDLLRDREFYGM